MTQGLENLHLADGGDGKSIFLRLRVDSLQGGDFPIDLVGPDEHAPFLKGGGRTAVSKCVKSMNFQVRLSTRRDVPVGTFPDLMHFLKRRRVSHYRRGLEAYATLA